MEHSDDRTTSTPSSGWTRQHGRSLSRAAGQRDASLSPRAHSDDLDLEDFSPQAGDLAELDLDDQNEDEARFLRATKRVSVRKGPVTRRTATRIRIFAIAA